MVPFSANADEMRDDRGGVRYAGLPRSTAARNSSTILWAELHGAVAALLFARQRQIMFVHDVAPRAQRAELLARLRGVRLGQRQGRRSPQLTT